MESKILFLLLAVCLQRASAQVYVRTTLTEAAQNEGAVCLDGSPAIYYMREGSGDGTNRWILHLMGGGWCSSPEDCMQRSEIFLGSSNAPEWEETVPFAAFLSSNATVNPDFYNWNSVFLVYCDGGIFAGDKEEPDIVNGRTLYFRGYRNLQAIIRDLNENRGLSDATDVILTGCSAGGLGTFMHADFVQTLVPSTAKYRAFADAGYLINITNVNGANGLLNSLQSLFPLHNISEALIPECREEFSGEELWRCLSGPTIYQYVSTPLFVLNPQYDSVLLETSYFQPCLPPNCDEEGVESLNRYKEEFDRQVQPILSSPQTNGYFLDSCYIHCQTFENDTVWTQYAINGRSMRDVFGDWYFDRSTNTRLKDCDEDYPCNPTCPDMPDMMGSGAIGSLSNPYLVLAAFVTIYKVMSLM